MKDQIFLWSDGGKATAFERTTVRALGHNESFLEDRIAERPELLQLDSLRSGIRGPYRAFQQCTLPSPIAGRIIAPDILLVSASAHLIAVEVKLHDNQELLNRAVVAQVVEYAACLSALDEDGLLELFDREAGSGSLANLCASWFPEIKDFDFDEFADTLANRCSEGDVDLVIACDRCPPGLDDLGGALDRQSALAFRLRVAEVSPWVVSDERDRILFLNRTPVKTEIVARTQVVVSWAQSESAPSISVTTTSLEDVEEAIKGQVPKKAWSAEEIRASIERLGPEASDAKSTFLKLLDFCLAHSHGGRITNRKTVHPTFNLRVRPVSSETNSGEARAVWTASLNDQVVWINCSSLRAVVSEEQSLEAERRFANFTDPPRKVGSDYIVIPISEVSARISEFEQISIRIMEQAAS